MKSNRSTKSGAADVGATDGFNKSTFASLVVPHPPGKELRAVGAFTTRSREERRGMQDSWRSDMVQFEVALKQLVAQGPLTPPTETRLHKVLALYDAVTETSFDYSPALSELLKLLRVELHRSLFTDSSTLNGALGATGGGSDVGLRTSGGGGGSAGDYSSSSSSSASPNLNNNNNMSYTAGVDDALLKSAGSTHQDVQETHVKVPIAYFKLVEELTRTNQVITAELVELREEQRQYKNLKETEKLRDMLQMYEVEVDRLTRDHDRLLTLIRSMEQEKEISTETHKQQVTKYESEQQKLAFDNKDQQLQLFQLRKQMKAVTPLANEAYKHLRESKAAHTHKLFGRSDERSSVLLMGYQLESRLNDLLDAFDREVIQSGNTVTTRVQRNRLVSDVAVIIEEILLCEKRYSTLTSELLVSYLRKSPPPLASNGRGAPLPLPLPRQAAPNAPPSAMERVIARLIEESKTTFLAHANAAPNISAGAGSPATGTELFRSTSPEPPKVANTELSKSPLASSSSSADSHTSSSAFASEEEDEEEGAGQGTGDERIRHSSATAAATMRSAAAGNRAAEAQRSVEECTRDEWVGRLFATKESQEKLCALKASTMTAEGQSHEDRQVSNNAGNELHTVTVTNARPKCAEELMRDMLTTPLSDFAANNFMCNMDLFAADHTGTNAPRFIRTIRSVDPVDPISLPYGTTALKIKYENRMRLHANFAPGITNASGQPVDGRSGSLNPSSTAVEQGEGDAAGGGGGGGKLAASRKASKATGHSGGSVAERRSTRESTRSYLTSSRRLGSIDQGDDPLRFHNAGDDGRQRNEAAGSEATMSSMDSSLSSVHSGSDLNGSRNDSTAFGGESATERVYLAWKPFSAYIDEAIIPAAASPSADEDAKPEKEFDNWKVGRHLQTAFPETFPFMSTTLTNEGDGKGIPRKDGRPARRNATTNGIALRLNPLSPNRGPQWRLYVHLFNGFRPLVPRALEPFMVDWIILSACERFLQRMSNRYNKLLERAMRRITHGKVALSLVEREFRDTFQLTDFQEAVIEELEVRYSLPELVGKCYYELLCTLEARAPTVETAELYLACLRGFESPVRIHLISFVLLNVHRTWPTTQYDEEISLDDAHTVLSHVYASENMRLNVNVSDLIEDMQSVSRSKTVSLRSLRAHLSTALIRGDEPLEILLGQIISSQITSSSPSFSPTTMYDYNTYRHAAKAVWDDAEAEEEGYVRYMVAGWGLNKNAALHISAATSVISSLWCTRQQKLQQKQQMHNMA